MHMDSQMAREMWTVQRELEVSKLLFYDTLKSCKAVPMSQSSVVSLSFSDAVCHLVQAQ